jgi:hypothetical protein
VPELEQLALNSLVSPALILPGQTLDQRGQRLIEGGRPMRWGYVHFLPTRRRCQRRIVPGVTKRCPRSLGDNLWTSAANTARSAQSKRGVGLALRSTVTS